VRMGVRVGVVGREGMGEHMSCLRLCSEQSARSTLETFAFLFVTSTDCAERPQYTLHAVGGWVEEWGHGRGGKGWGLGVGGGGVGGWGGSGRRRRKGAEKGGRGGGGGARGRLRRKTDLLEELRVPDADARLSAAAIDCDCPRQADARDNSVSGRPVGTAFGCEGLSQICQIVGGDCAPMAGARSTEQRNLGTRSKTITRVVSRVVGAQG
jgi:hypothetical protein